MDDRSSLDFAKLQLVFELLDSGDPWLNNSATGLQVLMPIKFNRAEVVLLLGVVDLEV